MAKVAQLDIASGDFNALLICKGGSTQYQYLSNQIVKSFQPTEIIYSRFNLQTSEMENVDTPVQLKKNAITRTLFIKKKEMIILDNFDATIIVEHLFRFKAFAEITGQQIISSLFSTDIWTTLVLGFELSVQIQNVEESIRNHILDRSFHPLVIINQINNERSKKEHNLIGESCEEMMTNIYMYLKML